MSRESNLAKNTLIISLGTFLSQLTSLVTLPIVSAGLTKAEYGTYDLINVLVSLLLPVITLQIHAAAFRFLIDCRGDKEKTDSIISNILLFSAPILLASLCILFFCLRNIGSTTRLLICLYFFLDVIARTIAQIVRGLSFNKLYSASAVVQAVAYMLLIVYTIAMKGMGLPGVLLSVSVASLITIAFLVWRAKIPQHFSFRYFSVAQIKSMLAYSWPMVPNTLSNWVLSFSDRTVLTTFIGIEASAIYAIANKIPLLFTAVQGTFILAWQENASVAIKDKDAGDYYTKMFDSVFRILCGIMAILISCTPVLFALLIRGDYSESYPQMPILFIALLFSAGASFLGGIYVAHKKTKSVGISTMIAAGINLAVDLLLVKKIGIFAASGSTLVSYLFLFAYRLFNVKRFEKIDYNFGRMLLFIAALVGMSIVCWINNFWLNIVNAIIGFGVAVFINRSIISDIIRMGQTFISSFTKRG